MKDEKISTNGSLDCCSKEEIKRNKEKHLTCDICSNTGFLCPRTEKQKIDYLEGKEAGRREVLEELKGLLIIEGHRWRSSDDIKEILDNLTSDPQTPQTKTLKRSEEQVRFVSPNTSELHEVGLDSRFLTDKTEESSSEGCGFRGPTLWCGYDGLCDECKQKQEKKE